MIQWFHILSFCWLHVSVGVGDGRVRFRRKQRGELGGSETHCRMPPSRTALEVPFQRDLTCYFWMIAVISHHRSLANVLTSAHTNSSTKAFARCSIKNLQHILYAFHNFSFVNDMLALLDTSSGTRTFLVDFFAAFDSSSRSRPKLIRGRCSCSEKGGSSIHPF